MDGLDALSGHHVVPTRRPKILDGEEIGTQLFQLAGGTSLLQNAGFSVTKVEQLTGFPEMLDGRVKTLHPSIHGGILAQRDQKHHMEALSKHGIGFQVHHLFLNVFLEKPQLLTKWDIQIGCQNRDGIENIDIGGPAMIRAAAKLSNQPLAVEQNHNDVLVVVDSKDYPELLGFLQRNQDDQQFRRKLAAKAFQHVASYDSAVSEWLRKRTVVGTHFNSVLASLCNY
ncbi:hypothetical protein RHMOL_Rhmol04G0162500 [Rhododendron molle]|uniref:Uncharacterized protein n=1 Tax=Rhododendron molle TaxID=49168 RepID=A0ACC0P2P4_RHOML|nr:hypothetical protein RHMOL_Rhmol04G0162500 [Rhododendron molle]